MHGGNKEDFENLTQDDIEIMYIVSQAERVKRMETMVKMISGMFGGNNL